MRVFVVIVLGLCIAALGTSLLWERLETQALLPPKDGGSADQTGPASLALPAIEDPHRSPVAHGPIQAVSCVSLSSGAPVPFPRISEFLENGDVIHYDGNADGVVAIAGGRPVEEGVRVAFVSAASFCSRPVLLHKGPSNLQIGMLESADLNVRITNQDSIPVQGVQVKLLPPRSDGALWRDDWKAHRLQPRLIDNAVGLSASEYIAVMKSATALSTTAENEGEIWRDFLEYNLPEFGLTATSDSDGVVSWNGVPAVAGYQWGTPSTALGICEPKFVIQDARDPVTGDVVITHNTAAEDLSAPFELLPNDDVTFSGTLYTGTTLVGEFPSAQPISGSNVRVSLFHLEDWADSEVRGIRKVRQESFVATDDNQFFMIGEVLPGDKELRAFWMEDGNNVYFCKVQFSLSPGETKDLGPLYATVGSSMQIDLALVNERGERLAPSEHFSPHENPGMGVHLRATSDISGDDQSVTQKVVFRIGDVYNIHGLPHGTGTLIAVGLASGVKLASPNKALHLPAYREFSTVTDTSVLWETILEDNSKVEIVASAPPGTNITRVQACFLGVTSTTWKKKRLHPLGPENLQFSVSVHLKEGEYDYLLHTEVLSLADSQDSYYALGRGDHVERLNVELLPAGSIRGSYLGLDGKPLPDEMLFLSSPQFIRGDQVHWTHVHETGPDGTFEIAGLIPHTKYFTESGFSFVSGAPGEVLALDIVR